MGTTGAGKSSLGNLLLGKDVFPTSYEPTSCTDKTTEEKGNWCGDGPEFKLIDTPGPDLVKETFQSDKNIAQDSTTQKEETQSTSPTS